MWAEAGYTGQTGVPLHGFAHTVHAGLEIVPDDEGRTRLGAELGARGRIRTYGPEWTTFEEAPDAALLLLHRLPRGGVRTDFKGDWARWLVAYARFRPWMGGSIGDHSGFTFSPEVAFGVAVCRYERGCLGVSVPLGWDGGDPTHPRGFTIGVNLGYGWAGAAVDD